MENLEQEQAFDIAVNLFFNGEFTILSVIPEEGNLIVLMDGLKMAVMKKDITGHWKQLYKHLPFYLEQQIAEKIDYHFSEI